MKNVLRILSNNLRVSLFALTLLIVGLGVAATSTVASNNAKNNAQAQSQSSKASKLPSDAQTPITSGSSVNVNSPLQGASQGSHNGQNTTEPNINNPQTTLPMPAVPAYVSPNTGCTACYMSSNCDDTCSPDTPVPPTSTPSPLPPLPPASGSCGTCGTYTGPQPQRMMCPMYCLNTVN